MVNVNVIVGLCVSAVVVVVLFCVVPMMCSIIEDNYTVTDTSTDGWNRTANTELDSPAESWVSLQGFIVLALLVVIIGVVIISLP